MDRLMQRILQFRDQRNWKQFHTPKDLAISVSVEAAELLEHFQWRPSDEALGEDALAQVRAEVADILIYLLLFSETLGFDPVEAAQEKIDLNEKRFPVAQAYGVARPRDTGKTDG
ncbi:MAG: nucleotide pyrophosphohydrolase [Salaquimonas sp.]|jgi:NTP pyrophosphatase (non-canonical NTP hydrolase)|nr:nucleotide pyrophosphohydrolase [Salaquimonas sp.]